MFINESFLSFIWKHLKFDTRNLKTRDGQKIDILNPGRLNGHAGPDFLEARIKINDILWIGAVEIHVNSSHWNFHEHQSNPDYNKVILQVVWDHDIEVFRDDGSPIPSLELKYRVINSVVDQFLKLLYAEGDHIPCSSMLKNVKEITVRSMIEKSLMTRLEKKSNDVHALLEETSIDWEEVSYRMLMKNFGFKVNQEPMLLLSRFLPLKILSRHKNDLFQIEALLFGAGGFLEDTRDEYHKKLRSEYAYLAHKYQFNHGFMKRYQWKFMRMHPPNFPTIRIAQLAVFLQNNSNIFSRIVNSGPIKKIIDDLTIQQSPYWIHHYDFGKKARTPLPGIGRSSIYNILINTFVPVLVAFGKYTDHQKHVDKALEILEALPPENNRPVRNWSARNIISKNAFDTQGLLELYNGFCYKKQCLNCNIGTELLLNINRETTGGIH